MIVEDHGLITDQHAEDQTEAQPEDQPWSRMNPRMLLVHPLRELIRYLPVLLLVLVAGATTGENWWTWALSGLGMAIGVLRWFTTTYRITASHVEVRSGVLGRRALAVPRDRIRSVDVDSTVLHRAFGLSVVKVGTGASHGTNELSFDALSSRDVPALREELLRYRASTVPVDATDQATNMSAWRPSWLRYAPFTLTGVASLVVVAMFLLQMQFFEGGMLTRLPMAQQQLGRLAQLPTDVVVLWGTVLLVVLASAVAVVRYLLSYAHFAITRLDASTLHISHGAVRMRQVTLDETRLRGVQLNEPLSLRMLDAGSAHAIMTGLGQQRGGVALLSPPGPRVEALRVARAIVNDAGLGEDADPLTVALTRHGPRARRRRYTRAATFAALLAVATLVLQLAGVVGPGIWWVFLGIVPASAFLAWDRYRGLGHALLPGRLVMRSGSLNRRRSVLATEGIIGFTIRRSWFQRRVGLATLVATTAAGRHRYEILDLPVDEAWPIIEWWSRGGDRRRMEPREIEPADEHRETEWDEAATALRRGRAALYL